MDKNRLIAFISIIVLAVFGYFYYQLTVRENVPGENKYRLANQHLEDGRLDEALAVFDEVIAAYPEYKDAYMGRAITLMQLQEFNRSREDFDRAIALDDHFAVAFANRGILNDKTGRYEDAVEDYRKAIALNPELAEGPGWLWRFLRNIPEKPPSIADRADYIESQLKKPASERLLRVPEIDKQQRMYKK